MQSTRFDPTIGASTTLPPLIADTKDGLLLPRPGLEVAAVRAPTKATLTTTALDGKWLAEIQLEHGDFHVLPQVGYHYAVSANDVQVQGVTNSAATYLLGDRAEVSSERTMVPVLAQFWRERRVGNTPIHAMYTIVSVRVIGEIEPEAEGILHTNCGKFRLGPGLSMSPRRLIVCEQSGNNIRVVDHTFLVRQFAMWTTKGGDVREEFELKHQW